MCHGVCDFHRYLQSDLSSRPGKDTPMRRGRVRDSDINGLYSRIDQELAKALGAGFSEKQLPVRIDFTCANLDDVVAVP